MSCVDLLFEPDLSFFLPAKYQNCWFGYEYSGTPSIKHLLESLGIPHTEIGSVTVDTRLAGLDEPVRHSTHIRIYPVREETLLTTGDPDQRSEPRFILDNHLGKLARYLRMLGCDAYYQNDLDDECLAVLSAELNRILLTRDRRLLMRKIVTQGYCLRSLDPDVQVIEVVSRYSLLEWTQPLKRCLVCNAILCFVEKQAIINQLEPLTSQYYEKFKICPNCSRIYWKGSHYEKMMMKISLWAGLTAIPEDFPSSEDGDG